MLTVPTLLVLLSHAALLISGDPQAPPVPPAPPVPAAPVVPPTAAPLIEVTPPSLTINPDQANCPLQVKLKQKPKGAVSLYMQADNMGWSSCQLNFDENNWDKPQTVNAIPLPYMTDSPINREIEATFKVAALKDPSMNKNELKYKIVRDKGKGGVCIAWGDPHYTAFDGAVFDFLTCAGNFYFIKSKFLTIQTITRKWINGAHTHEAIAIRFGKTVYIIHADKGFMSASASKDGIQVVESADKKDYHLKLSEGSEIKLKIVPAQINYVDITVELAGHGLNQVDGLCGKWTGVKNNKFVGADGKPYDKAEGAWGLTWTVPANDNIFECKDACPAAAGAPEPKPINFCRIPTIGEAKVDPPYVPPTTGYTVPKNIPTYGNAGYKPIVPKVEPPSVPKDATPAHKAKCREICNMVLVHDLAKKYLAPDVYLSSCISDCCLTGGFTMVEGSKSSYLAELRTREKSLLGVVRAAEDKLNAAIAASKQPQAYGGAKIAPVSPQLSQRVTKLKAEVQALRDTYGLGGAKCPGNGRPCSGNGGCSSGGCMCKKDWTGIKCEISLTQKGYTVTKPALAKTPYQAQKPNIRPPCQQAILDLSQSVAEVLQETPSIADALNGGGDGGDGGDGGQAPPPAEGGDGGDAPPPADGGDGGDGGAGGAPPPPEGGDADGPPAPADG